MNTTVTGGDAVGANLITNNGANGIKVTNSVTTTIQFNTLKVNGQNGVQVSGALNANTFIRSNTLNTNLQNGVQVDSQALNTEITNSTIYSNTLKGVLVRDTGIVGTQRAKILDNGMQGNGAGGIDLTPDTTSPPSGPQVGSVTNPNHDIDPPYLTAYRPDRPAFGQDPPAAKQPGGLGLRPALRHPGLHHQPRDAG